MQNIDGKFRNVSDDKLQSMLNDCSNALDALNKAQEHEGVFFGGCVQRVDHVFTELRLEEKRRNDRNNS